LLLIDSNGHIIIANKASKSILSKKKRANQEKELKKFLCLENTSNNSFNILNQVIDKEKPMSQEIKTPDERYFRIDLYPLPKRDQADLRIILSARDITMEKQMMERMQQTERLSSIGKMAAGIAHEINNPLGVIQCYTDLVKDTVKDPETLSDIDIILKHTRNVQTIVRDLLSLSRPKQVISGKCSINKVILNAIEVFKTQSASKRISVNSYLKDNLPDIKCDAAILEQILTNLWLNAFDAIQDSGGTINISTQFAKKDQVLLCIEDNGPGISDHIISQIFDPFYTTKEVGKGTGLGLSVVYGFINEIGGRIEVESDETTVFNIFFPVVKPEDS
jgi:signal transduction histidine kinase